MKRKEVEIDKDTRILKHNRKSEGKKHSEDHAKGHAVLKPNKRDHNYNYLNHLDEIIEELDDEDDDFETDISDDSSINN